jgi:hypothetical protein
MNGKLNSNRSTEKYRMDYQVELTNPKIYIFKQYQFGE